MRSFYLKAITLLFMFTVSSIMLWAQEVNEKFALTTQRFLNEQKKKVEKPTTSPRHIKGLKLSEKMMKQKPQSLIASPDTVGGVAYISCFIHLKDVNNLSAMRSLGVEVEETFDGLDFVTAKVPVKQLEKLADIDNVTRIKVAQVMRPLTDAARQKTNVDDLLKLSTDATAAGITTKFDGTGVVLGVIDNGIDFQHIAFKDKNGNSRIKRAYVYDGSSETEYTTITNTSPTTDDKAADHGTHCASTAGGSSVVVSGTNVTVTDNHANATYGGMAPGADLYLAGVKGLYNTYLANALKKMVSYADVQGKPLVVSNSWGSHWGPHNGTGEWADLVGQYFGESHPGHIILFASSNDAGHSKDNEGGGFFVKKSSASSSSPLGTILRSNTYPNTDAGFYYPGDISMTFSTEELNCKIHVLNNSTGAILKSWTVTSSTSSFSGLDTYYDGTLNIIKAWWDNENYCIYAYTDDGLLSKNYSTSTKNSTTYYKSAYTLAIEVYPASGSASVNMSGMNDFTYFSNHLTTSGHTWTAGTDDMCVSVQATIPNAISVGAYVSKTNWKASSGTNNSASDIYTMGDIAYFSSYATAAQSPTGQAYPWITAPGARLAAGVNHYHNTSVDDYSYYGTSDLVVNNSNSPYAMMEGTSMATPVAAGIVAQWLQAAKSVNKSLTVNDVKTIMAQTAITDSYTNGTYASRFGNGKIDALAGIQYILGTSGTQVEPGTWSGNTLTIDAGASSIGYTVPYGNYYQYSTTQMLYTPAEIGKGGTISSIAFKVANSTSFATSEVKVYLGHKSGSFSSTSDYVTSSNLTLVYSGSPTLGQTTGWETLEFNHGTFTYNGTDNLVVVVTRKSTSFKSGLKYYYYSSGDGYTLYRWSDNDTGYGDVTNTFYNYSASTNRPAVRMVFGGSTSLEPGIWSGNTLTIDAKADSIGNNVPYNNYYQYSTSQMLYTPVEIGKGGTISSIAFKVASSTSFTTSELKVYLGHKSGNFSSTSDYVSSSDLTLVYSGSPTLGQTTGWETLTFNQGTFTYNGTENLVVVVTRKSDNYKGGLKYYYYNSGDGYTLHRRSDSSTGYGDVTNISYNYKTSTNRPAIRLVFGGSTSLEPGIWSGNTLTIDAKADSTGYNVPYNNFYRYSTTQMLYTPTEIGKGGTISSIAFKVASSTSYATSELKVYLGHKSGNFSSTSDYVPSGNLTLVYSGSPTLGQMTGWETLTFNQGTFTYNGTDNLVVVVTRKSDDYKSGLKYYYYNSGNGYTLYRRSDSTTGYGDVTNTYSYTASTNRPAVRMVFGESTPATGIAINATNFPDANFRNWLLGQLYGDDGVLTDEEIAAVKEIDVHSNNIQDLKGIEFFTALTVLYCYDNQLTALDVSKNIALTTLGCSINQLDAVDVSKNTELSWFNCGSNRLTTLNVSKNTKLQYLRCYENQLTTLDLSNNTALKELRCQNNPLQELDVLQNAALTYLGCNDNQLTMLDISNNTALTHLYCYDNQLTMLDVSKNTALNVISCYNNLLTELDVSGCSALTLLAFFQNQVKDASMDALVESLPVVSNSNLYVIYNENEHNVMDTEQVASAKSKGWKPLYYDGSNWLEYEGSEPTPVLELTLIDGEDYSNSRDKNVETLHYSRIFKNTNWQAWYVPFDVTLTSELMEHFAFAKFAGTYTEEDGGFYITVVRMKEGDVVKANTPYCVQAKVANSTNPQIITQTGAILKAAEMNSFYVLSAEKKITFFGNNIRRSITEEEQNIYALSGGKYSRQLPGQNLVSFRCYFTIEDREDNPYASVPNPAEVKLMVIGEDEETSLDEMVDGKSANADCYDLGGRKANQQNMRHGIYIVNGKKVIVK